MNQIFSNLSKHLKWLLPWLYVLLISALSSSVISRVFDKKVSLGGDNAGYYILGQALHQGKGYTNIHTLEQSPHTHFPPGYPAIIAAVSKVADGEILTIKKANGVFLWATVLILFFVFYEIAGSYHLSFVSCIFILLNTHLLNYSFIMMSEVPFLLFASLSLYLFLRMQRSTRRSWIYMLSLIFTLAICYHIRSLGIALIAGFVAALAIDKKWKKSAIVLLSCIALAIPWQLRNSSHGGSSYIHQLLRKNPYRPELGQMELEDWFTRFWINLQRYIAREIPSGTLDFVKVASYKEPITSTEWLIGSIAVVLILFGLFKLPKYRLVISSYFIMTFGVLLLWPEVWTGIRFSLALIPLFTFLLIYALYSLLKWALSKPLAGKKPIFLELGFVVVLLLCTGKYADAIIEKYEANAKGRFVDKYYNYFQLAAWAKENTPDTAVIACRKPQLFFLYSGRRVCGYKNAIDGEELIEDLRKKSVDYVVFDRLGYASTGRYLAPAIKQFGGKFKTAKEMEATKTYLFEFHPNIGYSGEFEDRQRSGLGKFTWENGNSFFGKWKDHKRNGAGVLTLANGYEQHGMWIDDKLEGMVELYDPEKKLVGRQLYKNNKKQ